MSNGDCREWYFSASDEATVACCERYVTYLSKAKTMTFKGMLAIDGIRHGVSTHWALRTVFLAAAKARRWLGANANPKTRPTEEGDIERPTAAVTKSKYEFMAVTYPNIFFLPTVDFKIGLGSKSQPPFNTERSTFYRLDILSTVLNVLSWTITQRVNDLVRRYSGP